MKTDKAIEKASRMRKAISATLIPLFAFFAATIFFTSIATQAQEIAAYQPRGLTAYEEFRGSNNDQGQFLIFDTNVGYDFNSHMGVDIGIPVYLLRPTITGLPKQWSTDIGDPYLDLRLAFPNPFLNYSTALTVSVPANETGAFSTGRLGMDWFNHFDHAFGPVVPFVNAGIANGVLDTRFLSQPFRLTQSFRTLGFIADTEGGMTFQIAPRVGIGGSYYALLPAGNQKAYSGIQNFFLLPTSTETVSQITHDHGYTAYLRLAPTRSLYLEGAYVHSLELHTDAATVTVGVDVKSLFSRPRTQQHY